MSCKCERCNSKEEIHHICMSCLVGLIEWAIDYQKDPGDLTDLK